MPREVVRRAAEIEKEYGPDIDEALSRWQAAGAEAGGRDSGRWVSVAFLFSRRLRESWRTL